MNIANLIKIGRLKRNINQAGLARMLDVAPSAVSQWESGKKIPSGDTLVKLAQILDIVSDIFPGYSKNADSDLSTDNHSNSSVKRYEFERLCKEIEQLRVLVESKK